MFRKVFWSRVVAKHDKGEWEWSVGYDGGAIVLVGKKVFKKGDAMQLRCIGDEEAEGGSALGEEKLGFTLLLKSRTIFIN